MFPGGVPSVIEADVSVVLKRDDEDVLRSPILGGTVRWCCTIVANDMVVKRQGVFPGSV